MSVDLVWLGDPESLSVWPLGDVHVVESTPRAIEASMQQTLARSAAQAWLFWDGALGMPDPERVEKALALPGDVWHAGLRLGMGSLPELLDTVAPTWMLNCDPDPEREATSWRLSLRACLVHTEVLRQMGGVRRGFHTLEGAALEMGHRYVTSGVMTRHLPWLVPDRISVTSPALPFEEELHFLYCRFGAFWSRWASARAVMTRRTSWGIARRAWRAVGSLPPPGAPEPYCRPARAHLSRIECPSVSVVIPTVDRYPYLRTLLAQLRAQTIQPLEILVIDQTPRERRDPSLARDFRDLPVTLLYQDRPGQCSSRNAALQRARGDYVLFLDDDDEIDATLIEAHLENLRELRADVSSGVADEVGAGPLPKQFTYLRSSDVFPTNNTMVRRDVLLGSGLFDMAYDRGQRADGDLGMRVYLDGSMMVLNPRISVLHHHAPQGGLRTHRARVITYASSRQSLIQRHLPSASEIYLAMRYFTPRQVREMLWLRAFSTFSIRGSRSRKLLKIVVSLICLPHTLWRVRDTHARAAAMLHDFPQIPTLAGRERVVEGR